MTKRMSKTQRAAILAAHAARPTRHRVYRDLVFTRQQWRSSDSAFAEGWIDEQGRQTLAGLIAAGVDMATVVAEAYAEAFKRDREVESILDFLALFQGVKRTAHDAIELGIRATRSWQGALDLLHAEAEREDRERLSSGDDGL